MTPQEKTEFVHDAIIRAIKECPFTFEGLQVELYTRPEDQKMVITLRFNEFGNCQQTLVKN